MMKKNKIMILGAGIFQLPAIRKAKKAGFHVVTVDNIPENIGHRYSDEYVNCSTVDRDGVYRAAKTIGISGICTFSSDVALKSVAFVCSKLDLPGVELDVVESCTQKHRFRQIQRDHGLNCPKCIHGSCFDDIKNELLRFDSSIIFKPADTSGSRGVVLVDQHENDTLKDAFAQAACYSRAGTVLAEEYIHGVEYGGDCFIKEGLIDFIAVTMKHKNGFIVTGHSIVGDISNDIKMNIHEQLLKCCEAVGYRNGPLNFDVILSHDIVYVLEISPRNGGNGIPLVVERAYGYDLEMASLMASTGNEYRPPVQPPVTSGSGSLVFGSQSPGKIISITEADSLIDAFPQVYDVLISSSKEAKEFIHNGNALGCVLFDCSSADEYTNICSKLGDFINIEVTQ